MESLERARPDTHRNLLTGWIALALALLSLAFGPPALTDSDEPQSPVYGYQLELIARDGPPPTTAIAIVAIDRATGRVAYAQQPHQRLAPASTTKIMTAIVALESGRLNDRIVIKPEHLLPLEGTGSSLMGLAPGDELSLEDLLWGLLLPSGNDAALAIAHLVGGGVDGFVKMMNQKAQELGLRDTHFVNPHGLDADGHYSSAYDLALMGRYALSNPLFARIVATERKVIQANRTFYLQNTNRLLARRDLYPGVDGIKTGTSDKAGNCLVASVTRDGHSIIVVVMGSQDREGDAAKIIDYVYNFFEWMPLPLPAFPMLSASDGRPLLVQPPPQYEMVHPSERFSVRMYTRINADAAGADPTRSAGIAVYRIGERVVELPLSLTRP